MVGSSGARVVGSFLLLAKLIFVLVLVVFPVCSGLDCLPLPRGNLFTDVSLHLAKNGRGVLILLLNPFSDGAVPSAFVPKLYQGLMKSLNRS